MTELKRKCYGDIPLPFKAGNETINYPKVCIGDPVDDFSCRMSIWLLLYR